MTVVTNLAAPRLHVQRVDVVTYTDVQFGIAWNRQLGASNKLLRANLAEICKMCKKYKKPQLKQIRVVKVCNHFQVKI